MTRIFISLDLPREVMNEIKRVQKIIHEKTLITGKFTETENLHLTLKFLGEVEEEDIEKIKEKLREIKFSPFEGRLMELGVFSEKIIRIIWIKFGGKGVFNLQKEIDLKLKDMFGPEERFMSHITLARVKKINDKKGFLDYLSSIIVKDIRFNVNNFYLMKSELKSSGPVYTEIEKYELRRG
jgi:RNA 2',3'-cyclic 3'-phosphodiesterase